MAEKGTPSPAFPYSRPPKEIWFFQTFWMTSKVGSCLNLACGFFTLFFFPLLFMYLSFLVAFLFACQSVWEENVQNWRKIRDGGNYYLLVLWTFFKKVGCFCFKFETDKDNTFFFFFFFKWEMRKSCVCFI